MDNIGKRVSELVAGGVAFVAVYATIGLWANNVFSPDMLQGMFYHVVHVFGSIAVAALLAGALYRHFERSGHVVDIYVAQAHVLADEHTTKPKTNRNYLRLV